ncbi:MAG: hypothetical protein RJA76_918 [Bacteroidota bacterium]|jgi:hypothetical protein
MTLSKKLHISLSDEGLTLSTFHLLEKKEMKFDWRNNENFSLILENYFQLHLVDLQEIEVNIINDKFLLTPKEYFSNLFISDFLEKAIGGKNSESCEIHHQEIEKEEAIFSFFIQSQWKDYIAMKFPLSTFKYSHFLGNQLIQTSKFLRNQMHVWIEKELTFVILRKNGKLHIANSYKYTNAIELAYYLHAIRESFDFIWTNDTFSIQGEKLFESTFFDELKSLSIPLQNIHEQA